MLKILVLVAVLATIASANDDWMRKVTTETPEANCDPAPNCDRATCDADPKCRCSGTYPTTPADQRPQIVYLTYDDAFSEYAEENFYRSLYDGTLKNPDGNAIRATHFLTASYTDYPLVHQYWQMGHEMGSHSITHRTDLNYWKGMNVDSWTKEIEGMRQMITQFAAIPKEDIKGWRSPFLQMGADEMFTALYQLNFTYDCSWASRDYGYLNMDSGLFPYTLDYASVQDCEIEPCPTCSYPGLWVQPMLDLEDNWFGANPLDPDHGFPCSMLDGCVFIDEDSDEEDVKDMLMRNFNRAYTGTRAPFGLYMHAAWFFGEQEWHYNGYKAFLEEIAAMDDVWIVTISEGINFFENHWDMTNEELKALSDADSPFGLTQYADRATHECKAAKPCEFHVSDNPDIPDGQERYMHICAVTYDAQRQTCPPVYPWLGDPCGGNYPCN